MEAVGEWLAFSVLEQGTRDAPKEVARRASWALQFCGGGFFEFKAREVCRQVQPLQ